jgi:hypothetical protein
VIICTTCDEPLIQELTPTSLTTVNGDTFDFKRATDHVACPNCGATKSVRALRAEAVARGDLAPAEESEEPDPGEVLRSILDSGGRGIPETGSGQSSEDT